jgi:GT2 family glycosyltransferase
VTVNGKFFRLGGRRFQIKGVTYGPFKPDARGVAFASPDQTTRDFGQIVELGANLLRIYDPPPPWFLDFAQERSLKVLVDVPWSKHLCFLDTAKSQAEARDAVRQAVRTSAGHPAVLAYSLVNEIPPDIVRWSGARRVETFIDELVDVAKGVDPDCLCTFTSFPPTEFLHPQMIDWVCFNVYLHQRKAFEAYMARLQVRVGAKPMVLGECGIDSLREGEPRQSEILAWQIESAARAGLAGIVLFSFTDDWYRGGQPIEDWAFGLTTRDRRPKESFAAVQRQFRVAPHFPFSRTPRVSVVVATYNGSRTLRTCLESLARLNYPDYEVIVVDDGSTDSVPQIAAGFPAVKYLRHANHGLSVARNTGIAAATGEIVAFTDDDCRADEDWLYHLVGDLLRSSWIGVGGHNFLPPEDSPVAAAVLVSPGGPAHVMLDDRVAEHVPGCNMAFWKWALEQIGGFDPAFRKAGDDVDICWRLQERGYRIGFSPAGFVWHHRRSTVRAYLRQQAGYGEAEALLARKHPEYFNWLGGGIWRGRIYAPAKSGVVMQRPVIYHGVFASGFFQTLYAPAPAFGLMLGTSLEYHILVTLPLGVLSLSFNGLLPLALSSGLISVGICALAAAQAELPPRQRRWWSRGLVGLLFFLQPIWRGWTRYRWRLNVRSRPQPVRPSTRPATSAGFSGTLVYWSSTSRVDRLEFLGKILAKLHQLQWQVTPDNGWSGHDLEIIGSPLSRLRLVTVSEELGRGERILRCRLRARWSLQARVLWGGALGIGLLVIGLLASVQPWIWMLLLIQPCLKGYFDQQQHRLQRAITEVVDEVAAEQGFTRFSPQKNPPETARISPA